MPHQVYHSWSRKPSEAARAAEFHAWQVNHMTSDEAQQAPDVVLDMFLAVHTLQLFYSILEHLIHSYHQVLWQSIACQ
jgi:flagellar hook-basal body complex protein FliE